MKKKREPKFIVIYEFENFKYCYSEIDDTVALVEDEDVIDLHSANDPSLRHGKSRFNLEEVLHFIPPVLDIAPLKISKTFTDKDDPYHWQQPCCTELRALELHEEIPLGTNFNKEHKTIDTYLGIPWATFIDKKGNMGDIAHHLKAKIEGYKRLAKSIGYTLNVHTVCQSVHWKRFLDYFYQIGVTDLHASHYSEVLSKKENPYSIRMHSWHIYAINVEDPDRNDNIVINKPIEEKTLLASFKGAHMPHYLSDVRLLLEPALQRDKHKEDIVIEVTDEWHFNKHVFSQQVKGIDITNQISNKDVLAYNDLLCNSIFTLCPEGAGINTIRFWEAMAVGSIPVLITKEAHVPMLFRLNEQLYKCCIFVIRDKVLDIFKRLRALPKEEIIELQNLCRQTYIQIKNQTAFQNQYNTLFGLY